MKTALQRLSAWYTAQCNGDWEHGFGFKITTLDNPGVAVDINLAGTSLAAVPLEEKKDNYESETEWMICRRTEDRFEGRGVPSRLEDIVLLFLAWADRHEKKG
jgi:hypothetical protein